MLGKSDLLKKPIYYTHYKIKPGNISLADTFFSKLSTLSDTIILTINSKKKTQEDNFHKIKEALFKGDEKQTLDFIGHFIHFEWIKAILDSLSISYPGLGLITEITHATLTFYKEPYSNKINCRIDIKQANISYSNKDIDQSESIDLNLIIIIDYLWNFFLLRNLYSESNSKIEKLILSKKKKSELINILCHQRSKIEIKQNIKEKLSSVTEDIDKLPISHLLSPEIRNWIKSLQTIETSLFTLFDLSVYVCISDILYALLSKEKKINFYTIVPIIDILSIIIKYNNVSKIESVSEKLYNFFAPSISSSKKMEFIQAFGTYIKTEDYSELDFFICSQKKLQGYSASDVEEIKKLSFQLSRQEKKVYLHLIDSLLNIFESTTMTYLEDFLKALSFNNLSCEILHNFLLILYQYKLSSIKKEVYPNDQKILADFKLTYINKLGINIDIELEKFTSLIHEPLTFSFWLKQKEESIQKAYKNFEKKIMGDPSIELSLKEELIVIIQKLTIETKNIKIKSQIHYVSLENKKEKTTKKKHFKKTYKSNLPSISEESIAATKNQIQLNNFPTENQVNKGNFDYSKINNANKEIPKNTQWHSEEFKETLENIKWDLQQFLTINCRENSADYNYSAENFLAGLKSTLLRRKYSSGISNVIEKFFKDFYSIKKGLISNIENYVFFHKALTHIIDIHNNFYYFERSRGTINPYFPEEKKFKNPASNKENKPKKNDLEGLNIQKMNAVLEDIILSEFDLFLSVITKQGSSSINQLISRIKSHRPNETHSENLPKNYYEKIKFNGIKFDFTENTFQKFMLYILKKTDIENDFLNKNAYVFIKSFPNEFFYKLKRGIFSSKKMFGRLVADILLNGSYTEKSYEDQIKCFFIKLPWYQLLFKYGILCLPKQANKISFKAIGKYLISAIYKKELEEINEIKKRLNKSLHSNEILTLKENQKLASELVRLIEKIISLEGNMSLEKTNSNMVRRDIALELGERTKSEGVQELLKLMNSGVRLFTPNQQAYWEQFVLYKTQIQINQMINDLQKKKKAYFEEIIQEHKNLKESLESMMIQLNSANPIKHRTKNYSADKKLFSYFEKNKKINQSPPFTSIVEEEISIYDKIIHSSI